MADGKIYITISDSRGGSGAGVSGEADKDNKQPKKTLKDYAQHRFFNFVESQAKQFVNYSIENIGNFTGNYQSQRNVEAMMRGISFGINLGTAIIAGSKYGPVGGIIAGAIVLGSEAISFGYQEKIEQFENRKTNRNIDMMRNRLGLQGLTDGSRTGGY